MKALVLFAALTVALFLLLLISLGKPVVDSMEEAERPAALVHVELAAARNLESSPATPSPVARARTAPTKREVQQSIRTRFARFGRVVAEQAVRVASCETGRTFNPRARQGSHYGLFQISRRWHDARVRRLGFTWAQMTEVGPNLAVAVDIYTESGWAPWTCRSAA